MFANLSCPIGKKVLSQLKPNKKEGYRVCQVLPISSVSIDILKETPIMYFKTVKVTAAIVLARWVKDLCR